MTADPLPGWIESALGHRPIDSALFRRALTHSSVGPDNYERLEFLGDRVLGLVVATWLFRLLPDEPEGKLSRRINALVSRETCAEVARDIGLPRHLRLGKQARDDGAVDSDNVLGDVLEALIGALFLEGGFTLAETFVQRAWGGRVDAGRRAPQHPKSALQELAAAKNLKPPVYAITGRSGPHHSPRFTVTVSIGGGGGEASADGSSKQEAETAAATKLLESLR
jgi:ribonuclease-3